MQSFATIIMGSLVLRYYLLICLGLRVTEKSSLGGWSLKRVDMPIEATFLFKIYIKIILIIRLLILSILIVLNKLLYLFNTIYIESINNLFYLSFLFIWISFLCEKKLICKLWVVDHLTCPHCQQRKCKVYQNFVCVCKFHIFSLIKWNKWTFEEEYEGVWTGVKLETSNK